MITHYYSEKELVKKWYLIDANDVVLGRLAEQVAKIITGKNKPEFTPNTDMGDFVIVINSAKVKVTGTKEKDMTYYHHSLYPGGLKATPLFRMRAKNPNFMIKKAVWGMVRHTPLGRKQFKKLKVYVDEKHKQIAQQPIKIDL
jgi:large subunit ribosomal protein L13